MPTDIHLPGSVLGLAETSPPDYCTRRGCGVKQGLCIAQQVGGESVGLGEKRGKAQRMDISYLRRQRYLSMMNTMVGRRIRLELTENSSGTVIHGIFHTSTPFRDMPHRVVVTSSFVTSLASDSAEGFKVGRTLIVNATKIKALKVQLKGFSRAAICMWRLQFLQIC